MQIRFEAPGDIAAVRRVVVAAFGQAEEGDLVEQLRVAGDSEISLVAEDDGNIVGHVMFSRLTAPEGCLALAPVAVAPGRQRQGIGSSLIRGGLARAEADGWQAVFVLGDPAYYSRFGFDVALADKFATPYPKAYHMALELVAGALGERHGAVIYAPPFQELD
jgi:putative acetyltransferase